MVGVKPDILALAKSLTLGKVAASAAIMNGKLASTAFPAGVDGGTYVRVILFVRSFAVTRHIILIY